MKHLYHFIYDYNFQTSQQTQQQRKKHKSNDRSTDRMRNKCTLQQDTEQNLRAQSPRMNFTEQTTPVFLPGDFVGDSEGRYW